MKAVIRTKLNSPIEKAWELVKHSQTLIYVCKGFLSFEGSNTFPKVWKEDETIYTRLKFFGLIPGWRHSLTFNAISDDSRVILTEERGGMVQRWDHEIKFEFNSDTTCFYTDTVEIKAGLFTPIVWLYANALYRYRHYRWKRLIAKTI